MPFYKALAARSKAMPGAVRLVVASPEPHDVTEQYLASNGLRADQILAASVDPKIYATPTLIVVDREARILEALVGLQPEPKQAEILSTLN